MSAPPAIIDVVTDVVALDETIVPKAVAPLATPLPPDAVAAVEGPI